MAPLNTMRSIELFAGAGGMALGLVKAGFAHEALIEWDKNACDTLRRNASLLKIRPDEVFQGDVGGYDFRPHAGVDLIAAGVPCQPFSLGGKHRGHRDERNLFPELFRAVRETSPKVVLVENVRGLARPGFRPYLDYILRELEMPFAARGENEEWQEHDARLVRNRTAIHRNQVTYSVTPHIVDCADFGIPQRRRRVLIVALRSDLRVSWNKPQPTHGERALLEAQCVNGSYWKEHGLAAPKAVANAYLEALAQGSLTSLATARWRTVRDAIGDLPPPKSGVEDPRFLNHVGNTGARSYPGHTGSPWDQPAKTIKAGGHGVPGGENMLRNSNGTVRYFTVREAARIQTFPDAFEFAGAWTECLRQIGNAVPAGIAEKFGRLIRRTIERSAAAKEEALTALAS